MNQLFQVFNHIPNQHYGLFKARIIAKNGEKSAWTPWQYVQAGDSTAPTIPTGDQIDFNAPIGAMRFRLTDAYIAAMESDIVRFRWYVQSRTGSGALSFDSSWTPTAVLERDVYEYTHSVAYSANTYYHVWCIPVDLLGNWDSTPGAAQEQNKQPGAVAETDIPVSSRGWSYSGAFTASDADTVAWASGTLALADGTTYSITGGNTGNMAAVTYIYWDGGVSTTAFQITTTAASSVGTNKILIAVAKNESGKNATFQAFNAKGTGVLITADNIAASTITGNEIAANTITAGNIAASTITTSQLNFTPLYSSSGTGSVIATINASAEGLKIDADNISISGSTTFDSGYDPTSKTAKVGGTYDSAASGARVRIFPDANTGIQVIDDAAADVFKVYVGGTGDPGVGDVIIGNLAGQYLKFDKSAAQVLANVKEIQAKGTYSIAIVDTDGDSSRIALVGTDCNFVTQFYQVVSGTLRRAGLLIQSGDSDSYVFGKNHIRIDTELFSGGLPGIAIHQGATGNDSIITVSEADLLSIASNGDITIDPAGGDVDFDACDIWLDSGKHLSLNGSTDSIYIAYDSGNTEILCSSRVNATGGFADNGTDGIDTTFIDNDGNTITVSGGIITGKSA
jgi:hypothetical protein